MPVKIKVQKDWLITEATLDPANTDLNSLDNLMKLSKGTGRITALYGQGGVIGINIEQKSRISEKVAAEVRKLVGVNTRELE